MNGSPTLVGFFKRGMFMPKIYARDIFKKHAQNPIEPVQESKPIKEPVKKIDSDTGTEILDTEETDKLKPDKEKTVRDLSKELIDTYFNDDKITEVSNKLQLIIQGVFFGERDKHTFSDKMMKLFSDWLNATTSIKANLLALDILSTPRIPPTVPTLQTKQQTGGGSGISSDTKPKIDVAKI